MFLVTNREVNESLTTHEALGARLNPKGANELRLVEARRVGRKWTLDVLPDSLDNAMAAEVGLPAPNGAVGEMPGALPASRYVVEKLRERVLPASGANKNLVVFVHGFNNDTRAVLDRAASIATTYSVEVLPFSWPANGGGLRGVASYKSDKRDALASVGALDRCLARVHEYIQMIHAERVAKIEAKAHALYGNDAQNGGDAEKWDRYFTTACAKECPLKVSLLLHSMGNYLYKNFMGSSNYRGNLAIFDNVVMVAADTNNEDHTEWVDRIQCRGRIFITLNENDEALAASRLKMGEQQKARLGHYPYRLDARTATYVDFTQAAQVGDSHAYFEGNAIKNKAVKTFFQRALNGEPAEAGLAYSAARNLYSV